MKRSGAALKTMRRFSVVKDKRANCFTTGYARDAEGTEDLGYLFAGRYRQIKEAHACGMLSIDSKIIAVIPPS
jgi:hypothetical protein